MKKYSMARKGVVAPKATEDIEAQAADVRPEKQSANEMLSPAPTLREKDKSYADEQEKVDEDQMEDTKIDEEAKTEVGSGEGEDISVMKRT